MKSQDKTWVYIAVFTLITALVWLAISVHSTLYKSTIPPDVQKLTTSLDPSLDIAFFDALNSRSLQ